MTVELEVEVDGVGFAEGEVVYVELSCPDVETDWPKGTLVSANKPFGIAATGYNTTGGPFTQECVLDLDGSDAPMSNVNLVLEPSVRIAFSGQRAYADQPYDLFIEIEEIARDPQREEDDT